MEQNIALSVLNVKGDIPKFLKEYCNCIERIEKLKVKSDNFKYIAHFDIMDNKFVPNTGVDIKYIKTAKNLGLYVDTHLMVENPIGDKYVDDAIKYGTDDITIHYEIKNFESVLKYLNDQKVKLKKEFNRNLVIGVAVKPNTELEELVKYKNDFSKLLVMSVEPGFGGQEYIKETNEKLKLANKLFKNHTIQVDGGVNFNTIAGAIEADIDSMVVGSYLAKAKSLYNNLLKLNILKDVESLPKDSNIEFDKKLLQIKKGGYGEGDILLGITVPNIRKVTNTWYKHIGVDVLSDFISSKYHEYRLFALISLSNMMKVLKDKKNDKEAQEKIEEIYLFVNVNIKYINNWDLTDEMSPNVIGNYVLLKDEREQKRILNSYIKNEDMWIKRIGVVSTLTFARKGYKDIPFYVCDKVIYDTEPLINKATGWILREVYKKHPKEIVDYLKEKNKKEKLPRFVVSYATEKMSKEEKASIKNV